MKKQLKKLNELEINLDLFYSINFTNKDVRLQGQMNSDTISEIKKIGFKMDEICERNNFLEFSKENIYITLT